MAIKTVLGLSSPLALARAISYPILSVETFSTFLVQFHHLVRH